MSPAALRAASATHAAETLLQTFAQAGYAHAQPAMLQPAEPFLDLSGEDIRRSLYLTTDASGAELCLRPDLTIPVARDYLASGDAGRPAGFYYRAPVFRYREGQPGEFLQAGVESFGRKDRSAADAEMLALGLQAVRAFGVGDIRISTGDVALFAALIEAIDLAPAWKRRLLKDFNRKGSLAQDLDRLTLAAGTVRKDYEGVLAALAGSDRNAALALVTDLMSIAGANNFGGRSVAEIADRFLEQSTLISTTLPADIRQLIERFLGIAGNPSDCAAQLRRLAADTRLDITVAIDELESRTASMTTHGLDVATIEFATAFGRGLDYYTGFEFEIRRKANGPDPLVAGGRYDDLLSRLGAQMPIPAVGFAVWLELLAADARGAAR